MTNNLATNLGARLRHRHHPARTATATAAVLGAAAIAMSACGSTSTPAAVTTPKTTRSKVTITYWSPGLSVANEVALFNKTHPDIHVVYTKTPGTKATYAKYIDAIKAGDPPDVGDIEYDELPQFVRTGGILDIAKYGANAYSHDFYRSSWSEVQFGGGTWAVPRNTAPTGLFYNAALFKRYGLAVPTTWAEFASEAVKVHAAHPGVYLADFNTSSSWFSMLEWQGGAVWYREQGNHWKLGFTSPAANRVANYWQKLISDHAVLVESPYTPLHAKQLSDGTLLSYPGPQWLQSSLEAQAGNESGQWRVAPMPQWTAGGHAYGQWGGSTDAVFKDSKHPQAALTFAIWLSTNAQAVKPLIGGWPAALSGVATPGLHAKVPFLGSQNPFPIFNKAQNDTLSQWNFGPDWGVMKTEGTNDFNGVTTGSTTLTHWLQEVQSQQLSSLKSLGIKAVG